MIDPKPEDVGRVVLYQGGRPDDRDRGVVTSFNDYFVFVRYGASAYSAATRREDLTWETEE